MREDCTADESSFHFTLETEDAREREKELEEEQSNAIELCRADAARKIFRDTLEVARGSERKRTV